MGQREQQEFSSDEVDRVANLSDAEVAAEARKIPDVQRRAILIRLVKARRQKWQKNLAKAEAAEKKLPHNTAAEEGAGDDIPKHSKVHYDDDSIVSEKTEKKSSSSAKADDLSAAHQRTTTTTTQEGDNTDVKESTVKGSAGISGASAGYESSKEMKVGEGESEVSAKTTKSADATIDWEHGKGEAKAGFGKEVKVDDRVKKVGAEGSIGYEEGHVQIGGGLSREDKVVDENGEEKSSSSLEAKGHVSTEGAGVDVTHSSTNEHGTKTSYGGGADVNWEKGTGSVHGNAAMQSKSGKEAHASISAGVDVQADEPVQVGDHWEVHYKIIHSIGGGVGGKNKSAGVDVSGKDEHYEMGTRSFKDLKEAKEFQEHAKEKIHEAPSTDTVAGAMALEIGESRGTGSALSGSAGVTGSFEGVKAGVSGHAGQSDEFEVRRVSETLFDVTYKHGSETGLDASLGGGPLSQSRGASDETHHGLTVRFDLSTAEGRKAFEQFQKDHTMPASGAEKRATQEGKGHEAHEGTKIAGVGAASYGRQTGEEKVVDDKGTHQRFEGGQSHGVDPTWVGKHVFGDDKVHSSVEVEAREENGKDDGYTVTGHVSGESGKYNRGKMQALSSGLVEHENWDESKAKASGDWSMTADIDKKTMHSLEKYSDRFRGKSKDDQLRALGEWVADDGSKAVQSIERWSGKALNWDLELKGDKNFPGRAGRLELEARMHKYSQELAKEPGASATVASQVDGEIAALKERREAVASPDKYTDLPDGLRHQQLKLIDEQIAGFESLRHRALVEGSKNKPGEKVGQIAAREAGVPGAAQGDHGPLAKLRDEIALADAAIAGYQKQNAAAIPAMKQALQHVDWSKQSAARIASNSDRLTTQAMAKDAAQRAAYLRLDDDRAMLLKNASHPDAAMPIAQKLLDELNAQVATAGEAASMLYDAARQQVQVTTRAGLAGHDEFWKEVLESMDGDDVQEEDDAAVASDVADDDPEPPPAHVSMRLTK